MASFGSQAAAEVGAAYRPAFQQANRQEQRVRNLDAKQARDERAYRGWLATTQRAIAAQNQQHQAQLAQVEQGFHNNLVGSLSAANAAAVNRGEQIGGQGAPAGADPMVQAAQGTAAATSANLGENVVGHLATGGHMAESVASNNFAFIAAQSAKRRAATLDAISKLAAARGDLSAKKAADTAKRAAELQQFAADQAWKQQQFEATQAYHQAQLAQGDQRLKLTARGQDITALNARAGRRIQRQRIAAGAKGGGFTRPQINTAQTQLGKALAILRTPLKTDKAGKPVGGPTAFSKSGTKGIKLRPTATLPEYSSWLQGKGIPPAIANAAAYKFIFKTDALPEWIARPLRKNHGI